MARIVTSYRVEKGDGEREVGRGKDLPFQRGRLALGI